MVLGNACAEVVVITAASGGPVSPEQVHNAYLGRTFEFKLMELPDGNAERDAFYAKALQKNAVQMKALWSRVAFTGKDAMPQVLANDDAVKKAVAADPKAIGYIDKAAVDGSVKVIMTLN